MKHFLLSAVVVLFTINASANNYYFSSTSGDDSRSQQSAQNPATPWKSLLKLNTFFSQVQPGDSILFKRGEIFYGSFSISKSGAQNAPIVLSAYGIGARPILTGLSNIQNWKSIGSNKWEADCASCSTGLNTVIIDNSLQALGRFPNSNQTNGGHLVIDSHNGKNSITDNDLGSNTNWTGAELVIRKNEWIYDRGTITGHSGNSLSYINTSGYEPLDWYGYFIQNDPRTLDREGEWYFNPNTHKLQVYSASNPTSKKVQASTVDMIITCTAHDYITFDNIQVSGGNVNNMYIEYANHITIQNADIIYAGAYALKGFILNYLTVTNSNINHALSNGIYAAPYCSNTTISKNTIHNIGLEAGMGQNNNQTYEGVVVHGSNNLIELNKLDSIGYVAIRFYGDYTTVRKNHIKDFALTKDDGGAIYTNGDNVFHEQKVLDNIIINGIGNPNGTNSTIPTAASGIYMDDRTANVEISGNTIANCSENGIFLHNSHEITVTNNKLFNNRIQAGMVHDFLEPLDPIRNINATGNQFFSKTATQIATNLESTENDIAHFGSFDRNFYCRPINESLVINTKAVGNQQVYNLEGWQSTYNKDWNAKKTPMEIPAFSSKSLGNNLFANGTFNSNVSGASSFSVPYYSSTTWSNDGKLDGGALKIGYNTSSGNISTADVILNIGSITAGKTYVISFSMLGINSDADLSVFLRRNEGSYDNLAEVIPFKNTNSRSEQEFLFHATSSSNAATLVFKIDGRNCPLYLDNVSLYEAAVTMNNVDEYVRFEYNATDAPKTIALGKTYMDLEKNQYANSITLAPFSSAILMEIAASTLPLKFVEFKGKRNGQYNDLKWITANEINTSHFDIERSANGTEFTKVGRVASSNVSTGTSQYAFTDYKPTTINNYYRLKQYDKDGKSTYSNVVLINYAADVRMTISPNPAVEKVNISLSTPQTNQRATLSIVSLAGVTVRNMQVVLSSESISVDVSQLAAGMYVVHVAAEGLTFNERFVKQ
ncbi:MAG: right-handed parallel beta-helix repeat-containing protein [Chitinophagaceae bacterium]